MWPATYAFSLPTKSDMVPSGSDWIHEIRYDGYRMMRKGALTGLLSDPVDGISSPRTSRARLATFYSASPAIWALRALSRSASIMAIAPADANIGSRSRTPRTRRTVG